MQPITLPLPTGDVPFFDHDTVLRAISPGAAIDAVRTGFVRFAEGAWQMPPKVYLESPPHGDFRAMPALGDDIAMLKWVTSFPHNAGTAVPTVSALAIASDANTGKTLAVVDGAAITALRTGAAAAVATTALARADARSSGVVGCGLHGRWAALCLQAAGFKEGVCYDPNDERAEALAAELGWDPGTLADALGCDVVTTVTPGSEPVIDARHLRPGLHINALGADGPGKAEMTTDAVRACVVFCDEWMQASHGGEIHHAVEAGAVARSDVTELGDVLTGKHPGRTSEEAVTLFDSTGLAIQDLALVLSLLG